MGATEWVKCSERLPEDGQRVLVMVDRWGSGNLRSETVDFALHKGVQAWDTELYCGFFEADSVVAWMPIPEYKPEGE